MQLDGHGIRRAVVEGPFHGSGLDDGGAGAFRAGEANAVHAGVDDQTFWGFHSVLGDQPGGTEERVQNRLAGHGVLLEGVRTAIGTTCPAFFMSGLARQVRSLAKNRIFGNFGA
jgi:hypothetical protein